MRQLKRCKDYITVIKDNQSPERTLFHVCNYSMDGNKIDGYSFEDGIKNNFTGNTFLKDGKQINTWKEFDENGKIISVHEYHERKDSKGNLTYLKIVDNDKVISEEFYLYNENNKETLRFEYNPEGHSFTVESYFDEIGRDVGFTIKEDNELFIKGEYEYIDDRIVIEKTYGANNKLEDLNIDYLDNNGKSVYRAYYDNEGNYLSSVLSIHRTRKLIDLVIFDSNHEILERIIYKYDENEKLIEEKKEFYNKGKLERTEIDEYEHEYY